MLKCVVPEILLLEEGTQVILVKNIAEGLFNGMTGTVHHSEKGSHTEDNLNGNLVTVSETTFEVLVYESRQQNNLASRTQNHLILTFALTVHCALGQTLHHITVDCYSYSAPGQIDVAIGRAVS